MAIIKSAAAMELLQRQWVWCILLLCVTLLSYQLQLLTEYHKRSIKATRYNYRPEVLTTPQHILKHVKPIIRAQQSPHKNTMSLLTGNPQNSDSPQKDWCPPDQKTDFPLSRPFSDSLLCSKPRGLQDDTDRASQLSLRHQQGVTGLIFKKYYVIDFYDRSNPPTITLRRDTTCSLGTNLVPRPLLQHGYETIWARDNQGEGKLGCKKSHSKIGRLQVDLSW